MLSQNILIALAGAAAVHALPNNMQARDETEDMMACASAMQTAYKGMPTPPPALMSFYVTQTQTDPCSMTLPASLQSAYSSMQSAAASWFEANGDAVSSAMEKCPDMASLTNDIQLPTCTDAGNSGNTSGGSSSGEANDDTSGGSDNDNDNDSDSDENAGHRNTGVAGLAVAAAAFIGVVAVVL
jgi:hypothetical protein